MAKFRVALRGNRYTEPHGHSREVVLDREYFACMQPPRRHGRCRRTVLSAPVRAGAT